MCLVANKVIPQNWNKNLWSLDPISLSYFNENWQTYWCFSSDFNFFFVFFFETKNIGGRFGFFFISSVNLTNFKNYFEKVLNISISQNWEETPHPFVMGKYFQFKKNSKFFVSKNWEKKLNPLMTSKYSQISKFPIL